MPFQWVAMATEFLLLGKALPRQVISNYHDHMKRLKRLAPHSFR